MNAIDTSALIYDRKDADAYECTDLNRVGTMCKTIADAAKAEIEDIAALRMQYDTAESEYTMPDFSVPTVTAKTDFLVTDTYTIEEMLQYLLNVLNVVTHFPPDEYRTLPDTMRFLTAEKANAIEWDLMKSAENLAARANTTERHIKNTAAAFSYSGEIFAGGIL